VKIDPTKAVPQAPRALRAGARARAAEGDAAPDSVTGPDSDAGPPSSGDPMKEHEPNRAAAEAACLAAADAYKASKGSDSAAALMHAEEMSAAAREACSAAEGSSAKLRGAEGEAAPPTKRPADMAPAPGARAIVAAAGGQTAAAHLEAAQLVALGRDVLARTGAATADAAMLKVEAALTALGEVKTLRAKETAAKLKATEQAKVDRLAAAVRAGMPRAQAFTVSEGPAGPDGKPTEVLTPKAVWMRGSIEELNATLDELGFKVGASTKPGFQLPANDEAGLAARAAASGMDIETRRAAEENQRRSAARENSR
jgi:hypothetical protein